MLPRRSMVCLLVSIGFLVCSLEHDITRAHGDNGVDLSVAPGPEPDKVTLTWTGGQPTFEVFRSDVPEDVLNPANSLGSTEDRSWIDQPLPASIWYYQVESPCVIDPPEICDGIDNDCDGDIDEFGAEDYCELPNATAFCQDGVCVVDQCAHEFSNCDGNNENGCEVEHRSHTNSCPSAEYLGSICGDEYCGFLCPATNWQLLAERHGHTSMFFEARAEECSDCCADVHALITLTPPAGTDFDLYVYSACGTLHDSSHNGAGQVEQIRIYSTDDCLFENDSFYFWVEVRFYSGSSCEEWSLTVEGTGCQE